MKFKDFKINTLYSIVQTTEAHFIYATSKTEKALYGYYLYFVDDEMEIEHFVYKEEINDTQNVFRSMSEGYSWVLIRLIFEGINELINGLRK